MLARTDAEMALVVQGLSHSFGNRRALDDLSFSLAPGDFSVLLGPNGAGKTTLFALITRLCHPKTGRIAVFGRDMRREPTSALARMGVVFQQPTLDLDLTVEQNLAYHAALHGLSRRAVQPRILEELGRIDLLERRSERVRQLSGGQRRRVELARALIHDPALLLLDEPTVGLDTPSRAFLLGHVRRLCHERGLAVLWATHLIDEAADSRVIVLHRGRIRADGPTMAVIAEAKADDLAGAFAHMIAA